jgi:sulfonate transport system ATP-binding protein
VKGGTLLSLRGVGMTYRLPSGDPLPALKGIDLEVEAGEFLAIVGRSGCGKSTLLRLIGGLEEATEGTLQLQGKPLRGPSLDRGMVFQEARLFPWMTAAENAAFGLPEGSTGKRGREAVAGQLEKMGLSGFEGAYPRQLSGGMQQRVALARALVSRPRVLLLDEPFGALDALTRIKMQEEILRLRQRDRITMVLVTHDIEEAVFLGDRVAVMGPRPGIFLRTVRVSLSHPRDRNGAAFTRIRREIFREFFGKHPLSPEQA